MKKLLLCIMAGISLLFSDAPDGMELLRRTDANMTSETQIIESRMIIETRRRTREIETRSHIKGDSSFTEYLAPAREAGIKMLKVDDKLWTYDPNADRTITISGHMLRQSISGSDLSYEDMMEEEKLQNIYKAETVGEGIMNSRDCWIVELTALDSRVAYYRRKLWIDKVRYLSVRGEFYAKSGKLLKIMQINEVMQIRDRWYPKEIKYKDALNTRSRGTRFIVDSIEFDRDIPEYIFTKAALKK